MMREWCTAEIVKLFGKTLQEPGEAARFGCVHTHQRKDECMDKHMRIEKHRQEWGKPQASPRGRGGQNVLLPSSGESFRDFKA